MALAVLALWRRDIVRFYRQRSRIIGALGTPVVFWILLAALARPRSSPRIVAGAVLVVTSLLEGLQRSSTPLLDAIRATFLGRALIGSTFSWWDFPHYLAGALIGAALAAWSLRESAR